MVDLSRQLNAYKPPEDGNLQFCEAAESFGIKIKYPANTTGSIERVDDSQDKPHNKNGWYVLYQDDDLFFGAYGSWSRGEQQKFCSVNQNKLTPVQSMIIQARQEEAQRESERIRNIAAQKAEEALEVCPPADPNHAYLIAKRVKAHGILQKGKDLLIPVFNANGEIRTYQTIDVTGKIKKFLKDGEAKGNFFRIGEPDKIIYVGEGYATCATVHELTGACVFVAFNDSNLKPVCEAVRQLYENARIVVIGDNDQWKDTGRNPGELAAKACAASVSNCSYYIPQFKNVSTKPTDFNDLFRLEGKDAVLAQIGLKTSRIKASPLGILNPNAMPKREFLYGNHLIRKYCSATISPGGVGKTQLVMTDAISLASGRMLLHDRPFEQVNAWHYNLEDPMDELQRRALAICQYHRIDPLEIENRLFLDSGRDRPLIVMEKTKQGEYARPDAEALYHAIRDNEISVLSIDPFVKVHYGDENSNKDIDEVLKVFSQIANDTNCAIDLVHHTKKPSRGESYAGSMDSARGASALSGAVRSARTITVMSEEEAQAFQIPQRTWFIRIDNAKANMSAPSEYTHWMERHSIDLPNGDKVGTLGIWKPPSIFGNNTRQDILELLHKINEGEYRKDVRSEKWIGYVISEDLNMNAAEAKRVIHKWTKDGVIFFELTQDKDVKKPKWFAVADVEKWEKLN